MLSFWLHLFYINGFISAEKLIHVWSCNSPVADNVSETLVQVRYDVMEVPITLPSQKPQADKPNPKQGIGETLFIEFFYLFMFILLVCALLFS